MPFRLHLVRWTIRLFKSPKVPHPGALTLHGRLVTPIEHFICALERLSEVQRTESAAKPKVFPWVPPKMSTGSRL
ncbi:MAG TPA: hypothetical protein VEC99_18885, partial [Clostridia bacterium]|nr:hypothetical protein [Clostridia bacterium]